jgi:tetratricopeptide (TPR) repeat protein
VKRITAICCLIICTIQLGAQPISQHYDLGMEALRNYRYQDAIPHFYECVREEAGNIDFLLGLATAQYQMGNHPEAGIYFREILKIDSIHIQALVHLGLMADQATNYATSQVYWQRLTATNAENGWFWKQYARSLGLSGDLPAAIIGYHKALEINPLDTDVLETLSDYYFQLGDMEHAGNYARRGLVVRPEAQGLHKALIRVLHKESIHGELLDQGLNLIRLGDSSLYFATLTGYAALQVDSLQLAGDLFEWICRHPKVTDLPHFYYALTLEKMGDLEKSLSQTQIAIEKAHSPHLQRYYEQSARLYFNESHYGKAIEDWKKAHALKGEAEYLFQIARTYDQWHKDKSLALKWYDQYLNSRDTVYAGYVEDRKQVIYHEKHQRVKTIK